MQTINKNKFEFDSKKLVWRISEKSSLVDENKQPIKYNDDEKNKGIAIVLPRGAKVVNLIKHEKDDKLTRILCYWQGKYRDGYISSSALDNYYNEFDENSVEVFLNDLNHLLNDRLQRYKIEGHTEIFYNKTLLSYNQLKQDKSFSTLKLQKMYDSYISKYSINKKDKPKSLITITDAIKKVYNPKKISSKILVMPLSRDWFLKSNNKKLEWFYDKYFIKSKNGYLLDIFGSGNVGDNINTKQQRDLLFDALIALRKFVIMNKIPSKESNWLINRDFNKLKNNTESVLTLWDDVWDFDARNRLLMTGFVLQDNFYGPIRYNQLITLLLHEYNVGINTVNFCELKDKQYNAFIDTHTPDDYYKPNTAANNLNIVEMYLNTETKNFKERYVSEGQSCIDILYQSHSFMSLINTFIFLN